MNINAKNFIENLSQNIRNKYSKSNMVLFFVLLCLFILIIPAYNLNKKAEKELTAMKEKLNEFYILRNKYNILKVQVSAIDSKRTLSSTNSIIHAMDEVFLPLGIKGKIKSIKDLEERNIEGRTKEKSAEVMMEQVSLNDLVNIFYKIENAPMLLKINKISIRKSFAYPELLDIEMNISLFADSSGASDRDLTNNQAGKIPSR